MEKVGDFEYGSDLIGHGAFALVYKGRHQKNHDYVVAIKVVPKGKLGKSQPLIGKEIKILQELTKLQHKNVVALLECVDSPKNLYIVIEYCNGGDLSEYLHAKGSLSEDTIRFFLRQIAEAMKVLNQKEVVHRDLKPQNILLSHSGKPNPPPSEITLKIADFGFARFLADGVMANTLCGSPMYMAPEVIMSLKYDAKADLWSIGTIVFQCLTGRAPFMAPNPQQLKTFYEKNIDLVPDIPNGTSHDLRDLLLRLMKRDAKDRLEFDELYNHPFLRAVPRCSSPVPVPIRRSLSPKLSPGSPVSPYSSSANHSWERDVGGEDMAQSNSSLSPSPINNSGTFSCEQRYSPPSPEEQGFVVVSSNIPDGDKFGEFNRNSSLKHHLSDSNVSPSKIPVTNKAFKKSLPSTNINLAAKAVKYQMMQVSSESDVAQASSAMQISDNACSNVTAVLSSRLKDAVPVPTQKVAYEQIENSLQNTSASSPHEDFSKKMLSPGTSPTLKDPAFSERSRRDSTNSSGSDPFRITDLSSMTPPSVQFTIGTPPSGGRFRSFSGSTPPPPSSGTPTSWRYPPSSSPLRRSGSTPPIYFSNPNHSVSPAACRELIRRDSHRNEQFESNRCLDFSDNSPKPAFGAGRAMTLPEFNTRDIYPTSRMPEAESFNYLQRSGSSGKLSDTNLLFGHFAISGVSQSPPLSILTMNAQQQRLLYGQPPTHHCCGCRAQQQSSPGRNRRNSYTGTGYYSDSSPNTHLFSHGVSPSSLEGLFIPELPEETLLEKEHNDTLAKLNFVSALVKCVMEIASILYYPLKEATCYPQKEDPEKPINEGIRKARALLLYMKALQLISPAFQLSKQEINSGKLQTSASVRNVLHSLKENYHFCLSMCRSLNTPGLLQSVGVDPSASGMTADKIIYDFAIFMCQVAAEHEVYGLTKESFHQYQTAQILLHSLGQQIEDIGDKEVLHKFRDAVQKRLEILTNNSSVFAAYHTT